MGSAAGTARAWGMPLVAVVASAFLLSACAQVPVDVLLPPKPTRPVGDGGPPTAVAFAPLRGTPADAAGLRHPSLAVKIDNHPGARPQLALNRSDIVFEELVEGGLTRYLVVWHSDVPEAVGPVRSIRPMDPAIVSPFGGVIAYSGGQEYFVDLMKATSLVNLVFDEDDTGLFERAADRPGPHDVILDATEAVGRNAELPPPPVQFAFGSGDPLASPALAAASTTHLALAFSEGGSRSWDFDAGASAWLRSQDGEPDLEASGERVRATNVVTLRVGVDWPFGEVPLTILVGSGEAWVSVAGRTAHGTWSKDAEASPIVLTADDGSVLRLAPGNTWVELVPLEGSVAFAP
ncbi:DUF3048 domain-containing protein [Agromyces bauzanensis]|nr:DUF3048 domain-containing protein [Agromyces bauzanensis]